MFKRHPNKYSAIFIVDIMSPPYLHLIFLQLNLDGHKDPPTPGLISLLQSSLQRYSLKYTIE